ncbi:xanthine dehydrogenase family protein molybdopterin-binding subunit [Agrobacterium salinitolerans]|uniref:xanthine dehydrogenase family protein molybdopterin-binding subunit n=1 Tax=Agrobacterium salinitolerans TaxID=1183413 RepID=UPI0035B004B0
MTGIELDRVEAWEKVTGAARYSADYKFPDMLYAFALRSAVSSGKITAIDTTKAESIVGVEAIVTHLNAVNFGWGTSIEVDRLGAEYLGREALGASDTEPFYRPFCGPDILFAGQWIAVVVADNIETARRALGCITVDIEEKHPQLEPPIAPGPFFKGDMQYVRGAAEPDLSATARVVQKYHTPMQLHQPMEPSATTAVWDGDSVTLYDSTQGTQAARDYIAASLGVSTEQVRVIAPFVGGGFGAKNQIWPHEALAAHLARSLARPVCMQLTRSDMAVASGYRSETLQEVELSASSDGRLSLIRHVSDVPTSLRGGFFEPCGLSSLMLYKSERIEVEHKVSRIPVATPTPFRAPGETPGSFALETALDELAYQLRINPLELRMRNFADRDYYHDQPWSSNNLMECYTRGAELFGWPNGFMAPGSLQPGNERIGYGVATTAYPAPALSATVRVEIDVEKGLIIETSATDIGTGMRTILAQTAATQLNLHPGRIEVKMADSDLPSAPTAGRSKSTASVLPALHSACLDLIRQLEAACGPIVEGTNRTNPFERMEKAGVKSLVARGTSRGLPANKDLSFYSFGVHFAEVAVDEELRRLRVRRVLTVVDCGRILNKKLATSQIMGGVVFGVGMALFEEAQRHPAHLRVISDNLADYVLPVHADIPKLDVHFIDVSDDQHNELGVRGLGEIGLPGVAAAIGNAYFNATGIRCRSLPITPATMRG